LCSCEKLFFDNSSEVENPNWQSSKTFVNVTIDNLLGEEKEDKQDNNHKAIPCLFSALNFDLASSRFYHFENFFLPFFIALCESLA
jgi:hypothetical protein